MTEHVRSDHVLQELWRRMGPGDHHTYGVGRMGFDILAVQEVCSRLSGNAAWRGVGIGLLQLSHCARSA